MTLSPANGDRTQDLFSPLPRVNKRSFLLPLLLFLATVVTTLMVGSMQQGGNPFQGPAEWIKGVPFSFSLMAILLTHELAHYFTSIRHGLTPSLPYFIPAPPPFIAGTFGAFIQMRSPILRKKALLDVGASGPLAGFLLSIAAVMIGLKFSHVVEEGAADGIKLGSPLIFSFLTSLVIGSTPENYDIMLHPVAFAGWIGFFVTSLNLIPIGQLDGGHVAFAVLGRWQKKLSLVTVGLLIFLGIGWPGWFGLPHMRGWPGWLLWAGLAAVLGVKHPPIVDDAAPLDRRRQIIGWVTLVVFILTFIPVPFSV